MRDGQIVDRIKQAVQYGEPTKMGAHTRYESQGVTVVVRNDTAVTLWGKPYIKGSTKHRRRL